jgi:hypothetical protein
MALFRRRGADRKRIAPASGGAFVSDREVFASGTAVRIRAAAP